jgi:succinoglycan biosynthesis transport protein ExoP
MKNDNDTQDALNIGQLWNAVKRHKLWIVLAAVMGLSAAGWYTRRQPKLYSSRASVLIENPSVGNGATDSHLAINVEVTRAQALLAESAPVIARTLELSGEKLQPNNDSPVAPALTARIEEQLLYLEVTDGSPNRAAKIANAWASAFVEEMTARIKHPGVVARDFINKSLPELRREWMKKQEALNTFERESFFDPKEFEHHPIRSLVEELGAKLNEKNVQLATLAAERDMVDSKAKSVLELMQLPRVQHDPTMVSYRQQLEQLRTQMLDAKVMYKPDSPQVTTLQEKYQRAEEGAREALANLKQQIAFEIERAELERDRLQGLQTDARKEFEGLKDKAAQYKLLSTQAAMAERMYSDLEHRKDQSELDTGLSYVYARLWEDAQPNYIPVKPSWRKNLLAAGLASVFGALMLIFASEFFNSNVRGNKDLEQRLGVHTLGMVPVSEKRLKGYEGYFLVQRQARSAIADSLRNVYIRLESEHSDRTGKALVLTVTSAAPSDGKSFIASNLAELFASLGQNVLLIDSDTRKHSLSDAYGCENDVGWTDLIRVGRWAKQFACSAGRPNLSILPAGKAAGKTSERLCRSTMTDVVEQMKSDYDVIIFDTPPILALSDACMVSKLSNATIVVARSRKTRMAQVERTAAALKAAKAHNVGFLVNGVEATDFGDETYGYHAYGYGYEKPGKPGTRKITSLAALTAVTKGTKSGTAS